MAKKAKTAKAMKSSKHGKAALRTATHEESVKPLTTLSTAPFEPSVPGRHIPPTKIP